MHRSGIDTIKFYTWPRNAFTYHFNILNNITWYFVLPMLRFTFLRRDWSLLLMAPQTCTLTGDFTVVWIHLAWYFSFYLRQTRQWRRLLWLWYTGSCGCVVFPQKGYIFRHQLVLCHSSKRTRTILECKGIRILKWPRKSPEMNSINNVWNIMKKEIGSQRPCLKEEVWKQVCEAWYSVASKTLEELNNSMSRLLQILSY